LSIKNRALSCIGTGTAFRLREQKDRHPFTLSAPFCPDGDYEITVKREPKGVFSRWLFDQAKPGQILRISKPQGQFCLPEENTTMVVCLSSPKTLYVLIAGSISTPN
jgi:ferredoxin-NADP reductase